MLCLDDAVLLPPCNPEDEGVPVLDRPRLNPDANGFDSRVFEYVTKIQPAFENLRQCAAQIAGLMVLVAAGGRCDGDHPMLVLAQDAFENGMDAICGAVPPAAALHHHMHVKRAGRSLRRSVSALPKSLRQRDHASMDAVMAPLQIAYRELQHASRCLPGFEVVDFTQGCCAAHFPLVTPT
mgnify:CR=1 FL=1|tara:strand:- start:25506 stop:26048 length:543 start_codon:yes stop_codon:yes gene_type:complete